MDESLEGAADRLVAETVDLLFGPLGMDVLPTGTDMLKVVADLSDRVVVEPEAGDMLSSDIQAILRALEAEETLRRSILKTDPFTQPDAGRSAVDSALLIARNGGTPEVLAGLAGVTEEALRVRPQLVAKWRDRLQRSFDELDRAQAAIPRAFLSSVTNLKPRAEIPALRDKGSLWGLVRTRSDSARDRCLPHLRRDQQHLSAEDIATLLSAATPACDALAARQALFHKLPDSLQWLVSPGDRRLREERWDALSWALAQQAAGLFGSGEIHLLSNQHQRWRSIIADPEFQRRCRPRLELRLHAYGTFTDAALQRLMQSNVPPASTPVPVLRLWRKRLRSGMADLVGALFYADIAEEDPESARDIAACVAGATSPGGAGGPSPLLPGDIQCQVADEVPDRPGQNREGEVERAVVADLAAAVELAVQEGAAEVDNLEGLVGGVLSQFRQAADRMRAWDDRPEGSIRAFIELADEAVTELDEHFHHQREVLGTFNIAFFGRTGAGKSTLLSALGELDGQRVSQGESDWTTTVEPIDWRGCRLYDTPGINGWGRTQSRKQLEETARRAVQIADIVLLCFDSQSQQAAEFAKVASWVRDYGKPAVAVLNVRNPRWRHPAKVPNLMGRRNLSESVRQHVQNIVGELTNIDLAGTPVVAVHARRALDARAATPYLGPDPKNFLQRRQEFGIDYLNRWSNFEVLEELVSATVLMGGADLRVAALRDGVRSTLEAWDAALGVLSQQAQDTGIVIERSVQNSLNVLGYPESERTEFLWDERVTGDILLVSETARAEPFTSPHSGSLDRHTRHLLRSHLTKLRAKSLRKVEDMILSAFDNRKEISEKRFRAAAFDDQAVDKVVERVWKKAGDFLERELHLAAQEGDTDLTFLRKRRVEVRGDAGGGMRFTANALRAAGLVTGGAAATLAVLAATNFWNPAGWIAALALAGLGIASGLMKWFGGRARRKAEKQRVTARSQAIGGARRAINDYYDTLEENLAREIHISAWNGASQSLRDVLWEAITLRRAIEELQHLGGSLTEHAEEVPKAPPSIEVLRRAEDLVLSERAIRLTHTVDVGVTQDVPEALANSSGSHVWLGEDWLEFAAPEKTLLQEVPPGSAILRGQRQRDTERLECAMRAMWTYPTGASVARWMDLVRHAAREDAELGMISAQCQKHIDLGNPEVTVVGDFSAGKSSLLKRLLLETGNDVPATLGVRADPTTEVVRSYDFGPLTLVDTPGFQSGFLRHDDRALEAVSDATLVIFVFHVNLLIGDPGFLESVISGSPLSAAKGQRAIFLINRSDELGVDPGESPEEFLSRRTRKEAELLAALQSRGIPVLAERIHSIASDPFGLVGDRREVTREDYEEEHREWDGVDSLLAALRQSQDLMLGDGLSQSALDIGTTQLMLLAARLGGELAGLEREREGRAAILQTLEDGAKDADIMRRSLMDEAGKIVNNHANSVLADAMGAGPDEVEALAERLASWWEDPPLTADLERYGRSAKKQIDLWYSSYDSAIRRDFRAAAFKGVFPGIDRQFRSDHMAGSNRRSRGASHVVRGAADTTKAVGSRDAVYAIGKAFGHKFKPWGAVKGGARFARAGAVLSVVAVGLDAASWVKDQIGEDERESARRDAAAFIQETAAQVVAQVTSGNEGEGPLSYLTTMEGELAGFAAKLIAEQSVTDLHLADLGARIRVIDDLLSQSQFLFKPPEFAEST